MKPDLQEPPIKEQMGLTAARQLRGFKKGPTVRRHERPELFNSKVWTISGFEIWITPYNRFFLVDAQTGACGYPRFIEAGYIMFEPALNNVPSEVLAQVEALLAKQKALRRKMVEQGEYDDGEAWEWST